VSCTFDYVHVAKQPDQFEISAMDEGIWAAWNDECTEGAPGQRSPFHAAVGLGLNFDNLIRQNRAM